MHPVYSLLNYKEAIVRCDWKEWDAYKHLDRQIAASVGCAPLPSYASISMLLPTTPEMQKRALARIVEPFKDIVPLPPIKAQCGKPRIGYIGAKLEFNHVSALLFTHLFPHHNTNDFDVIVFTTRSSTQNHNLDRLLATKNITVIQLGELDDQAAAEVIATYQIDLLISTDGWNDDPRPGIVARRPAVKQALWQGTATTSSAPWFDYVIVDRYIDGQEPGWRSEEAVIMPDSYYVAGHVKNENVPPTPSRENLGIPNNKFVFSNFNSNHKFNPDTWSDWMTILRLSPNSVFVLVEHNQTATENLKRRTKAAGVAVERLIFLPKTDPWNHIARMGVANLFLDSYYFGAHTTLAESLWMDVPAISLIGNTMSSRVGYSMLNSVGLSELTVPNRAAYIALACELYNQPLHLDEYKRRLVETKHQSSVFDMRKQADSIEQFVMRLRNTTA